MYLVILFTDDNALAVIPENWIDPDGIKCALWPHYKSTSRIMNAVKQKEVPGEDWQSYPFREMYRCVSYDKARTKLREAEENSDLQTATDDEDDNEYRRSKRPRRERDVYSDDEMVTENRPHQSQPKTLSLSLPKPPSKLPTDGEPTQSGDGRVTASPHHSRAAPSSPHVARDVRLFTILEKILAEQKDQKRMLNRIYSKVENCTEDCSGGLPEGIVFPLTSVEGVNQIETLLEDKATFSSVVAYLSMFGGHNLKQTVTRLLKETMSSRLAENYNFLGKKGKLPFGKLKIASVLFRSVQRNDATKQASVKEFEDFVKEWLRGAKDRDGGRKRRFTSEQNSEELENSTSVTMQNN